MRTCLQVARRLVSQSRRVLLRSPSKSPLKTPSSRECIWARREDVALVEYVSLHAYLLNSDASAGWPATKDMNYWDKAASYVKEKCQTAVVRKGNYLLGTAQNKRNRQKGKSPFSALWFKIVNYFYKLLH